MSVIAFIAVIIDSRQLSLRRAQDLYSHYERTFWTDCLVNGNRGKARSRQEWPLSWLESRPMFGRIVCKSLLRRPR